MTGNLIAVSDCRKRLYALGTRVLLDSKETPDVYRAEIYEDGMGRVFCYDRDSSGRYYLVGRDVATVDRVGRVELIPPDTITPERWREILAEWVIADSHG